MLNSFCSQTLIADRSGGSKSKETSSLPEHIEERFALVVNLAVVNQSRRTRSLLGEDHPSHTSSYDSANVFSGFGFDNTFTRKVSTLSSLSELNNSTEICGKSKHTDNKPLK